MICYSMLVILCTVLLYMPCAEKPVILLPVGNPITDSNSTDQISYIGVEISTL